jgi:hypothetical protein
MQILMARLTQVSLWNGESSNLTAIRLAFCKGLMRAIVASKQPAANTTPSHSKPADIPLDDEMELSSSNFFNTAEPVYLECILSIHGDREIS